MPNNRLLTTFTTTSPKELLNTSNEQRLNNGEVFFHDVPGSQPGGRVKLPFELL